MTFIRDVIFFMAAACIKIDNPRFRLAGGGARTKLRKLRFRAVGEADLNHRASLFLFTEK